MRSRRPRRAPQARRRRARVRISASRLEPLLHPISPAAACSGHGNAEPDRSPGLGGTLSHSATYRKASRWRVDPNRYLGCLEPCPCCHMSGHRPRSRHGHEPANGAAHTLPDTPSSASRSTVSPCPATAAAVKPPGRDRGRQVDRPPAVPGRVAAPQPMAVGADGRGQRRGPSSTAARLHPGDRPGAGGAEPARRLPAGRAGRVAAARPRSPGRPRRRRGSRRAYGAPAAPPRPPAPPGSGTRVQRPPVRRGPGQRVPVDPAGRPAGRPR